MFFSVFIPRVCKRRLTSSEIRPAGPVDGNRQARARFYAAHG
jgi:hypothetical protein